MRARNTEYDSIARGVSDVEGARYVGVSVNTFRKFSAECGARFKIGNRVLNDRNKIDAEIERRGNCNV